MNYENIKKNTVILLSKAKQSKAKQSKAKPLLYLLNNFKFYILQFFKTFNFLSVFIRFAKNQFAILITRGFNPLRSNAIAHNGLKPHCYKEWIASSNAFAMTIKNNLVNTFLTLTKFTFDSLSRKIKNPCLVINKKFFNKGDTLMYQKRISLLFILAFSLSILISCGGDPSTNIKSKKVYSIYYTGNNRYVENIYDRDDVISTNDYYSITFKLPENEPFNYIYEDFDFDEEEEEDE